MSGARVSACVCGGLCGGLGMGQWSTCRGLRSGGSERWLCRALIADWAEMRDEYLTKQQPCNESRERGGGGSVSNATPVEEGI